MKKILLFLVIILVIVIVALYFSLDALIKISIEKFVPPVTGTNVTVSSVSTSLLKGEIAINGLDIQNPQGFKSPSVFRLGRIAVKVDPFSLFSKQIVVDKININQAVATFEIGQNGTNVTRIQKNVEAYSKKNPSTNTSNQSSSAANEKTILIKDLLIEGAQIQVATSFDKKAEAQVASLPLPTIHLTNIGKDNRQTLSQAVAQILNAFSAESLKSFAASGQELLKQNMQNVQKQLDAVKSNVKDKADDLKNQLNDAQQNLKEDQKDLKDSLKGLFK